MSEYYITPDMETRLKRLFGSKIGQIKKKRFSKNRKQPNLENVVKTFVIISIRENYNSYYWIMRLPAVLQPKN